MGTILFITTEQISSVKPSFFRTTMHNLNRLYLLPDAEIADLYARPIFNKNERMLYFSMTKDELYALGQFRTLKTKVYFLLQLAYFKAKNQFFTFSFEDVKVDISYIMYIFFQNCHLSFQGCINRKIIKQQRQIILNLFNYKDCSSAQIITIENHACELLRYHPKIQDAFCQLLTYFDNQRIVIPTYRNLQEILTKAITREDKRLEQIISLIPKDKQERLSDLIKKKDGVTQLNSIRSDQKNFTFTQTRAEVNKSIEISQLYEFAKLCIPHLLLSKNAIRYYADLTDQYPASRLRRINKTQQRLQMLCFIHYRYQKIMDNLITSFIYHIRKIDSDRTAYVDKKKNEYNADLSLDLPKLAKFLHWFPKRDPRLDHEALNKYAYNILPQKQFHMLAEFLEGHAFNPKAAIRDFYLKSTRLCALYLRPILLHVPFVFYKENSNIIDYINLIRNHYSNGKSPSSFKIPKEIENTLSSAMLPYLKKDDGEIDPYLFEFFVYHKMYTNLNSGLLCCNESVSYCDIDNDLVSESVVDDVEKIAEKFGFSKLPIYCDQRLDEALQQLDAAWDKTTSRINANENKGFTITETKTGEQDWKLEYDTSDKLDDVFFKDLSQIEIADIVTYIGDKINIWECFSHMKSRYTKKKKVDPLYLSACILSDAFGMGIEKMSEISDLDYNFLRSTQEDFMRIDNLEIANDQVSNLVYSLPIFKLWNLMDDKLLADADGQKLATSESTIQSRYSKKYLGKSPGISIYTLVANFIPINAKNIGLNEYEGHSLYDVVYGNKTNVNVDMVTGDGHSLNKHNFVILDSIDVGYVPSIKDIKEAANHLYSVKPHKHYKGIICSQGIIDQNLIKSQKQGILRVLLSLLLQENSQSNIVKKINSYARYNKLKKALFEYNRPVAKVD